MSTRISKILSANELGLTGSHQAGILIPKDAAFLDFFPKLDSQQHNPRATVLTTERDTGTTWEFSFIYYNNKSRGGTRDEYRLTGMTRYLREVGANVGDVLSFERDNLGNITISLARPIPTQDVEEGEFVIVLSGKWKFIQV